MFELKVTQVYFIFQKKSSNLNQNVQVHVIFFPFLFFALVHAFGTIYLIKALMGEKKNKAVSFCNVS